MGLLRGVRILPGREACSSALTQVGVEYLGSSVPCLPLAQCTRDRCECEYVPVGSDKLRQLNSTGKSSPKLSH